VNETIKARKPRHFFTDPSGNVASFKVDKLYRDVLTHHLGTVPHAKGTATIIDFSDPLMPVESLLEQRDDPRLLIPGKHSPFCQKCELDTKGARRPYFEPYGPEDPLITVVLDSVSPKEDGRGELASDGTAAFLAKIIDDMAKETGVTSRDIRWAPATRCANRSADKPNLASKGNVCKHFLVQEILGHPPKMLVPIGTVALGLLCHKSNAQDWGGHLLTYRGWPDDWLTNAKFMLPRPDPLNPEQMIIGHPLFGQAPNVRMPMFPLQSPRIIYGTQNPQVILRWKKQLKQMLKLVVDGTPPLNYDRPWYRLTCDPAEIIDTLQWLTKNPRTKISYDTETNGLYPWMPGSKIVFMMFRWKQDGQPKAIGFPWDYPESPLVNSLDLLTPHVLEALYASDIVGHNGAFDAMFTIANVTGCDLNRLAPQFKYDTWHMVYTMRQQRGTISLDMVASDWVPDLAGYEEDMTLLIDLHHETMHPESGQHAHFARCPEDKWESHLKPYVMGDVEVCYQAQEKIQEKLDNMRVYRIPLAHHEQRGRFRYFQPQSRADVYKKVISPANGLLIKMMARGMKVDLNEIALQEDLLPKQLMEMRERLRTTDPRIISWCDMQQNTIPGWELDLEKPDHLRSILFKVLELPIQNLTDKGVKIYGENPEGTVSVDDMLQYAKVDKFTLNKLAVTHPQIRPLQEYRRAFKAYSAYIRPIRNAFKEGFDKKRRKEVQHLARDGCVHARFLITGTRSGRLSSQQPNLQQVPRDGLIKRIYCSRFGNQGVLYQGDLSQIELRLIAAACGDEAMVDAYMRDIDLHSLSMSRIFNMPYEHCIKDYVVWLQRSGKDKEAKEMELRRKIAKTINFLTGYGGGAYGLQATLANDSIYFNIEQCEAFLEAFFDSYPALRRYLAYYKRFIADNAVAVSILGRVRVFEEVLSDNKEFANKALRAGCNHLIQATASDMMLVCLCVIEELMRQEGLESMLVSTVHDSLVIDAKLNELQQVHEIVYSVFNNIPEVMKLWFGDEADLSWMIVPFAGDCEMGFNYLDTKKVPNNVNVDWDEIIGSLKKAA